MNLGLIGTGAMGLRFLAAVRGKVANISFVGAYNVLDSQRELFLRTHPEIPCCRSLTDLIEDPAVDAVYVATPLHTHAALAVQAAEAGKHILCEKPMALTLEECDEMVRAAERKNVILQIGYAMRFHPIHQHIRQQVADGALGQVIFAHAERTCYWDYDRSPPPKHREWFLDPSRSGGGVLTDLGSHLIDLLIYLLDDQVADANVWAIMDEPRGIETTALTTLKFRRGACATVLASHRIALNDNLLQVYGTKGAFAATRTIGSYADGWVDWIQDGRRERLAIPYRSHFLSQLEHFEQCVRTGETPITSGRNCLESERTRIRLTSVLSRSGGGVRCGLSVQERERVFRTTRLRGTGERR